MPVPTPTPSVPAAADPPYQDVGRGAWYYDAAKEMFNKGLMKGVSDTRFAPNTEMTRAMVVTVLFRLAGEPAGQGAAPDGTLPNTWYTGAVNWAYGAGITNGAGGGFGPELDITREQLVTFLYRFAMAQGLITGESLDDGPAAVFSDWGSVSPYAQDAMKWAVSNGIIQGMTDAEIAPKATATRAQFVVILSRFIALYSARVSSGRITRISGAAAKRKLPQPPIYALELDEKTENNPAAEMLSGIMRRFVRGPCGRDQPAVKSGVDTDKPQRRIAIREGGENSCSALDLTIQGSIALLVWILARCA